MRFFCEDFSGELCEDILEIVVFKLQNSLYIEELNDDQLWFGNVLF